MPLYSRREFALLINVSAAALTNAKKRRAIVVREDGLIDSEHRLNKAFALKMAINKPIPNNKGGVKKGQKRGGYKKQGVTILSGNSTDAEFETIMKLKAERFVKEKQVLRLDAAARVLQFKADRMRGDYLPTTLVKELFSQHFQSMIKAFQYALEAILTDLAARHKINRNDQAEYRKKIIDELNLAIERAIIDTEGKLVKMVEAMKDKGLPSTS